MSCVKCHVSNVMCQMSCVLWHVSHVTWYRTHVEASWWLVFCHNVKELYLFLDYTMTFVSSSSVLQVDAQDAVRVCSCLSLSQEPRHTDPPVFYSILGKTVNHKNSSRLVTNKMLVTLGGWILPKLWWSACDSYLGHDRCVVPGALAPVVVSIWASLPWCNCCCGVAPPLTSS